MLESREAGLTGFTTQTFDRARTLQNNRNGLTELRIRATMTKILSADVRSSVGQFSSATLPREPFN